MKKGKSVAVGVAFLAVAAIIMLLVFILSGQNGSQTNMLSEKVTEKIASVVFDRFDKFSSTEKEFVVLELNRFIRKCAHFGLYASMGFVIYTGTFFIFKKRLFMFLSAFFVPAIYAVTDEIHQYFVDGRTPLVTDVLIDSAGALLGILVSFLIISTIRFIYWESHDPRMYLR